MSEGRPEAPRGLVWSHLLASILGGLAVAGVLLAFGVIGNQRTTTVPINENAAPVPNASDDNAAEYYYDNLQPGVLHVSAKVTAATGPTPYANAQKAGTTLSGTGFLISAHGLVLTADHLVAGASSTVTVTLDSGITRSAKIVSVDPSLDVALLQVSMNDVPAAVQPLPLGRSSAVKVGETALRIANPFGLDRTLASGIVSALQRQLPGPGGSDQVDNVIQTDLTSSAADSGSPLLNDGGSVIGLNTALLGNGYARGSVPFTVPMDTIRADANFKAAIMAIR